MGMMRIKCPLRHRIKVDEAQYNEKVAANGKIKCRTCNRAYDANMYKVMDKLEATEQPEVAATTEQKPQEVVQEDPAKPEQEVFKDSNIAVDSATTDATAGLRPEYQKQQTVEQPKPAKGKFEETTVSTFLSMIFNSIAAKRGEFWKLKQDELDQIVPLLTKVINKHFAPKMGAFSDEITLGIALGVVILGRYVMDMSVNKGRKAPEEQPKVQEVAKPVEQPVPTHGALMSEYPGLGA